MSEPTKDETLAKLADAKAAYDQAVMVLIWLELGELLTGVDAGMDQAAARLRDACEALREPEAQLVAIGDEITAAEGKCAGWQARLSPDQSPDKRAAARIHFNEWNDEITQLQRKRDWAEAQMQPLVQVRDQARKTLADYQAVRLSIMAAQLNPFGSALGQATQAYIGYRQPYLNHVLLKNDRNDQEWETAVAELEECCLRSAYRTDHLPSEAEQAARAMTAAMASAPAPLPVPSGQEIVALETVKMENNALQQRAQRDLIEDRRYPAGPRTPVQKRSYMEVPRMSEYLR